MCQQGLLWDILSVLVTFKSNLYSAEAISWTFYLIIFVCFIKIHLIQTQTSLLFLFIMYALQKIAKQVMSQMFISLSYTTFRHTNIDVHGYTFKERATFLW